MKQLLLVCLLVISSSTFVNAQKVKIKKGLVKVDGKSYCRTDCKGVLIDDCQILSLQGEILASITFHQIEDEGELSTAIVEVIFAKTAFFEEEAEYKAQVKIKFKYRQQIIKAFYQYRVIQFNQLDEVGVKNFVNAYSIDYLNKDKDNTTDESENNAAKEEDDEIVEEKKEDEFELVKRDRNAKIFAFGKILQQDFKEIGKYELDTFTEENVMKYKYSFYLPNGTLVAEAVMKQKDSNGVVALTTMKDNEVRNVILKPKFVHMVVEDIAKILVKQRYL
jgi:hypothetical protein